MANKSCPRCGNVSEDPASCGKCGLNYAEYEQAKLERLGAVHHLLSENKFKEAKQLAEKLPAQFPDKKTDFVLLLSNINRDISIVDKCELAQKAYDEGDYNQACIVLRNIKAFDSNLNERVVSLRRKAERIIQDHELFIRAEEAFNQGEYAVARALFKQLPVASSHREEVTGYLRTIDARTKDVLKEAIDCINTGQFALAESKFGQLQATYPDLQEEMAGYLDLLARRVEIKDRIVAAAAQARSEQRVVEAKILYSYLGLQFPEFLPEFLPRLREIGSQAVISLADLQASGAVDLAGLGVELAAPLSGVAGSADLDADIPRDPPAAEIPAIVAVAGSSPPVADEFSPPVEINVEEIPDFIF